MRKMSLKWILIKSIGNSFIVELWFRGIKRGEIVNAGKGFKIRYFYFRKWNGLSFLILKVG